MNEKSEYINIFSCNICNKTYSSKSSLCNHTKKFHNSKSNYIVTKTSLNDNQKVTSENEHGNLKCRYCEKMYKHKQNRWLHEKKCKIIKDKVDNKNKEIELEKIKLEKMKEEKSILKLKIKLQNTKRLDNKTFKAVNKYLMDRSFKNSNNNNTINSHNTTNNYQILSIGNEQLTEVLTLKEKKEIMNSKLLCLNKIVEIAHCGKYNKFKNIIITNLKDNFAYKYDEDKGYFITTTKNDVFNDLLSYRITDIEAIYTELSTANKIDNYTKDLIQKFLDKIQNEDQLFTDHNENITYPNYKTFKINDIKILLYNNQDKITKDIALLFSNDSD